MSKFKVAVIGVGYLGEFHAQKYHTNNKVKLIGIVDTNNNRCRKIGNALGVNSNFEALVVKKIHSDTGESVGKTPDLNQQKLNQHIREYQKLALEELQ